jgi:hypothetical protein
MAITGEVNNMSTDKKKKIDTEITEIHTRIKKSNLVLRQRIKDIQQDMMEWDSLGGFIDGENNSNGHLRRD